MRLKKNVGKKKRSCDSRDRKPKLPVTNSYLSTNRAVFVVVLKIGTGEFFELIDC